MAYVPSGMTLPESTMYTPELGTFSPLTSDSASIENGFQWLDNNNIIYQKNRDIFLTDRLGSFHQQLTQVEQQILPEITPTLCEIAWSPVAQRVYFTVGCADNTEYLYSIDLNGNVRFELSVIELYSDGYLPFFVPMDIVGIFPSPSSTDVLLLLDVATANPNDSSIDMTLAIHRLTAPQTTELVFERRYTVNNEIGITSVEISPDQTFLAFAGGDQATANSYILSIVNLTNGTVAFEQSGLQGICDLDWLSTTVVVYETIPRLNCFADRFATNIQSVDVTIGSVNNISMSASVVAVPQPIITAPTACDLTIPASDTAALISAITAANGAGTPQTLCLTDSTYTLDTAPTITSDITIVGDGATIIFADGGGFEVAEGGTLTLLHVTVIGAA